MPSSKLYQFVGKDGAFRAKAADRQGPLYFPLVNEQGLMAAITPDLHGDIKADQHAFFNVPVAFEDLSLSRASRNFWIAFPGSADKPWSVTGRSVWQRASEDDETCALEAGFLWQKVSRTHAKTGLAASVTSFVPARDGVFEVMAVELTNTSKRSLTVTATSAIPLFGRSADNLRDHRHVTSLLNRLEKEEFGLRLKPTMSFNERGHVVNEIAYVVLGIDQNGRGPIGFYPTLASFVGTGDLEKPEALTASRKPHTAIRATDQGKEALGGLRFAPVTLKPGERMTYTLFLGIEKDKTPLTTQLQRYAGSKNVGERLGETKEYWEEQLSAIRFDVGLASFNPWVRWVQLQPILRKLYGCSFLPDFDYGRGGRGWRDLWQDCLALLLASPDDVRDDIRANFGGVRIDGSNATIIGRGRPPVFVADRNNITRTWMDHGIWPVLTTLLYLNQTGDWDLLLETAPYFRDKLLHRAKKVDSTWDAASTDLRLKTSSGQTYEGTVLEHMLVQTLVPFFHVGEHNIILLEDADWNDGLDMAPHRGESVAFTCFYGGNLASLADILETFSQRTGDQEITMAEEIKTLFDTLTASPVPYDDAAAKKAHLKRYFESVEKAVSGKQVRLSIQEVARDLRAKSEWIRRHVNKQEWVTAGETAWFNGYYDDDGQRVEGKKGGRIHMTLAGQVYPIMARTADDKRVEQMVAAVNTHLWDEGLGGVRLNTDFGSPQPKLGRAFSFAFGEKENGAVFSHMAVMYASALYQRNLAAEGWKVLSGLYTMATDSGRSRIFPGLPEYFNNEGQGRYAYLTGSASWYVLTLLTQVYGVRGEAGDLLIAPKLEPDQFNKKGEASVRCRFAGTDITVVYRHPKKRGHAVSSIQSMTASPASLTFNQRSRGEILIPREAIANRAPMTITVELG